MSLLTSNSRRLRWAKSAIKAYCANPGVDDSEDCQFIDLFADLLHLAQSRGIDGEDCYRIGCGHYRAERNGEEEDCK